MKKLIICLLTLCIGLAAPVAAATSGSASPSANVAQLINIAVEKTGDLGDIRVAAHTNLYVMKLTIDNNDDDGYTLTFQSQNGTTYGVDNNFGYLIHNSAADNTAVTPNEGQKPSTRYELMLGEDGTTTEYGHVTRPGNLDANCESPSSGSKFEISDNNGTDVNFNNVSRATRAGVFRLCLTQASDIQLFHGEFSDTLIVSIADN